MVSGVLLVRVQGINKMFYCFALLQRLRTMPIIYVCIYYTIYMHHNTSGYYPFLALISAQS